MVTALYRRYRPETFAELIGQSQVTDPLRTALRTDRVNHAYLFSGPRGCGKTTSARILARCLNCAEGPTDTPCGVCPSCVELGRDGGGSLDVVEIDAASHNGVDDARDLRERAVFAPARDRYKIFILDEAHMVTPQGFNALLKIVEEPPEHVKFIFATTEPEKVIGTIRSRTHHYPFRLVPPATMLEYLQQLCESEKVQVEAGVLPLVVRAGGGSVRDTLSLLDQLIAGSEGAVVGYERAVALLGYTHGALLDEIVDAIGAADAPTAFAGVDRVIQTGQDPRRFVEDLLERLRDLIVVAATREGAAAVLRGVPQDEIDRMSVQATAFGAAELSRAADVANAALTEMTGATSPRLHLELLVARLLVPATDDTERGALARVERLERRMGIEDAPRAVPPAASETPRRTAEPTSAPAPRPSAAAPAPSVEPERPVAAAEVEPMEPAPAEPTTESAVTPPEAGSAPAEPAPSTTAVAPVTIGRLRDAWPEILEAVEKTSRSSWLVVYTATPRALADDVLTLAFRSQNDVAGFRPKPGSTESVSEHLRSAIADVLGIRVKFLPRVEEGAAPSAPAPSAPAAAPAPAPVPQAPAPVRPEPAAPESAAAPEPVAPESAEPASAAPEERPQIDADGWAVVSIPHYDDEAPATAADIAAAMKPASSLSAPAPKAERAAPTATARAEIAAPARPAPAQRARYGEAVVRELLKAEFIEEQQLAPRDAPVAFDVAGTPAAPTGGTDDLPPEDVPPVPEEDR
ncbi:DNA polymerase III subunit gamma and tau [Pseudolysinimonas sp.]|uniref:DNA polymerase III subunit gamma and tau n=1 Tax=Pseudolysinimonas sp. TaxID=2680009 RepID=UPI003F80C821